MEEKIGVIYKYTSPSCKVYIGQTVRENKRKSEHKHRTIKSRGKFGLALKKYGYENFKYEVIIKFNPTNDLLKLKRVLDKLEIRYIKLFKSDELGYNICKGGEGVLGFKHSEETKKYIGECTKTQMTQERRQQIINQHKGKIITKETKQQMSNSQPNKGKGKVVYKYDLENNLLETFSSIGDAARSLNIDATLKTKSNRISEVCSSKWKSYQNFIWSFENNSNIK